MTNEIFAKEHLLQYITRVEKLEEEKAVILQDIKEVLADAKNNGFEIKILKHILKLRKVDKNQLAEEEALIELYRKAVGI